MTATLMMTIALLSNETYTDDNCTSVLWKLHWWWQLKIALLSNESYTDDDNGKLHFCLMKASLMMTIENSVSGKLHWWWQLKIALLSNESHTDDDNFGQDKKRNFTNHKQFCVKKLFPFIFFYALRMIYIPFCLSPPDLEPPKWRGPEPEPQKRDVSP